MLPGSPAECSTSWAFLDASTRCGEGRARRARTETRSRNAAPSTREPSQDQSSAQEAQRKAQIPREVIFPEMAMKDAWRSWEGRGSPGPETVGHTHHSLSCALICEQERQLLSQFSICCTHPSGYLWLQSWGLAPWIGWIGRKASLCLALPTRSLEHVAEDGMKKQNALRVTSLCKEVGVRARICRMAMGHEVPPASVKVAQRGGREGGVCTEVRGMA